MEEEYIYFNPTGKPGVDDMEYAESDNSSIMDIEHKAPLVLCLYFFIPAIAIVILRDWFNRKEDLATQYNRQTRSVAFTITFILAGSMYYLSSFEYEHICYNKLYICSASYMSLFVVLLTYGNSRRPDVRWGIMIAYLGIALSFLTTTALYFYGEHEIIAIMYNTGVIIFLLGNVIVVHISLR